MSAAPRRRRPAAQRSFQRSWSLGHIAALLCCGLMAWPAWASGPDPGKVLPPAAAAPKARAAERAAWEALTQARRQVVAVDQALQKADAPALSADRFEKGLAAAIQVEPATADGLRRAEACLADLTAPARALDESVAAWQKAVAASIDAAGAVSRAAEGDLKRDVPLSQQAFAQRGRAEAALRQASLALQDAARGCRHVVDKADTAVDQTLQRAARLRSLAREVLESHAQLRQGLSDAIALDTRPGAPLPAVAMPGLPGDAHARRLSEALAPLTPRVTGTLPSALDGLQEAGPTRADLLHALARQADAAAVVDLLSRTPVGPCAAAGCPSFAADRAALVVRNTETRAALAAAHAAQTKALAALSDGLRPARTAAAEATAALKLAQTLAPSAGAEAREASQRAKAALAPLGVAARMAEASAYQTWEAAVQMAGGSPSDPPRPAMAAPAAAAPRPPMLAGAAGPDLRSHAYATFQRLDRQPENFGAYTYLLVSSASSLASKPVKDRFLRVVTTLKAKTVQARRVAGAQRPQVNVFCIPSAADEDDGPVAIVDKYLGDLGGQLLLHAQTGVLTKAMARQLSSSSGPFLLTLPVRIEQSAPDTPLLLADLSSYDEAAIADLVVSYMDGLVDDFPQRQAAWKPALPLTVGLTLVRWASAPARIVSSLIPPATAKPGN